MYIYKGHYIKKFFSQVFLIEKYFIDKIINFILPENDQNLIEIGPGLGSLTYPICEFVDKITVIEIDCDLANKLKNNVKYNSKINVINSDVRKINFKFFFERNFSSLRIFGSLPYNISIELIFYLFNYLSFIKDMIFLVQKEVSDRLTAGPNSKKYGSLSVLMQCFCEIKSIFIIPSTAFNPIPKVDSALVCFKPILYNNFSFCDLKYLKFVLNKSFSNRRKTIGNNLLHLINKFDFNLLDIDPKCRPENLSVLDYCKLSKRLQDSKYKIV